MEIKEQERDTIPPDWVEHPHTRRVLRQFQDELGQARRTLDSVAHKSPDPEVREASTQVLYLERFIGQLTGKIGGR